MEKSALFLKHMEDLARRAQKTGCSHSKFLSESEAALVKQAYSRRSDVLVHWEGGCEGAERTLAVFLQPTWGSYEPQELVAALSLQHRAQDKLEHRAILGATLALGIEREVLGDIFPSEGYLICLASIADFLTEELHQIGRIGVKTSRVPLELLPVRNENLRTRQVSVSSLRLDTVLAAAFDFSRTKASDCIAGAKVQVDHCEALNTSKLLQEGQLVSLRGQGRFRLLSVDGLTRKGRHWISLGFFE